MRQRHRVAAFACLAAVLLYCPGAGAQTSPTAYSVTEVESMMGPGVTVKIYRDGGKAIVDHAVPAQGADKAMHTRSLYDLQAGTTITWDVDAPETPCSIGQFTGDWGDPFKDSALTAADLTKQGAKDSGPETMIGIPAKVLTGTSEGAVFKAWVDPKSGLLLKLEVSQNGQKQTFSEVKEFKPGKPDASVFTLPAACKDVKLPPTAGERFAAETGGAAADFMDATAPPGSPNSCTVLFKAVYAGSMQTISGYKLTMDNVDKTGEMKNGILRIDNAPATFTLDLRFPDGGGMAQVYRQCPLAQTMLLMVQKDPANLGKGADWMWVKAGKFAK